MLIPNKERIQLLVDALKSGKFRQAQGNLRRDNSYCCLGVACEVYRQQTNDGHWRTCAPSAMVYDFVVGASARAGYLPNEVVQWFGFGNSNPILNTEKGGTGSATFLNDIESKTLPQVGDAFERTFLK